MPEHTHTKHTHTELELAQMSQTPNRHAYGVSEHLQPGHGLTDEQYEDIPDEYQGEGGWDAYHRSLHPELTQVSGALMAKLHDLAMDCEDGQELSLVVTWLNWLHLDGAAERVVQESEAQAQAMAEYWAAHDAIHYVKVGDGKVSLRALGKHLTGERMQDDALHGDYFDVGGYRVRMPAHSEDGPKTYRLEERLGDRCAAFTTLSNLVAALSMFIDIDLEAVERW